jgi:head-tail adaptor
MLFEILTDEIETDSDGAHVEPWVPAFSVSSVMPVELEPLSAGERDVAASRGSETTHRLRVRFREGFLQEGAQMRATIQRAGGGGQRFNITGALQDKETGQKWITLTAKSGLSDGR